MRLLVVLCLVFAVVRALIWARGSSGALCSTGRAGVRFRRSLLLERVRSGVQSVSRSVLIEYSRAGRRSMAMKPRRELSPPVSGSS